MSQEEALQYFLNREAEAKKKRADYLAKYRAENMEHLRRYQRDYDKNKRKRKDPDLQREQVKLRMRKLRQREKEQKSKKIVLVIRLKGNKDV